VASTVRDIEVKVLSDGSAACSPEVHSTSIEALRQVAKAMSVTYCQSDFFGQRNASDL
jgi:hypothetical protein